VNHRRYAILGTGALGGFYGARLQRAGCDVHFLLHRDYDHVRQHGLICESRDGDFTLPVVQAYRRAADLPPCDVTIVALKTTQNHLLPELLPPTGLVLTLQNGLGNEAAIARVTGPDRVLGGLAFLCSNKVGPGHIRHLDYGHVALGEFATTGITDRLRAIAADFERAGIPVTLEENLAVARWRKLVWNIPYNGLSVILDAQTDELMRRPATRQLCEDIMREVVAAARATGVPLGEDTVTTMLAYTDRMKPYRTSMKIDYDEGRPLEIEAIFGEPLRAATAAGHPAPLLAMLYRQLQFLDAHRPR
jgi:2-dehydropantoate 2-reductase